MPKYTVQDGQTGKNITFQWDGQSEPTDADMEEVAQAAGLRQSAPRQKFRGDINATEMPGPQKVDDRINWNAARVTPLSQDRLFQAETYAPITEPIKQAGSAIGDFLSSVMPGKFDPRSVTGTGEISPNTPLPRPQENAGEKARIAVSKLAYGIPSAAMGAAFSVPYSLAKGSGSVAEVPFKTMDDAYSFISEHWDEMTTPKIAGVLESAGLSPEESQAHAQAISLGLMMGAFHSGPKLLGKSVRAGLRKIPQQFVDKVYRTALQERYNETRGNEGIEKNLRTGLDEGIIVGRSGMEKGNTTIDAINDIIDQVVKSAPGERISVEDIAASLDGLKKRFSDQVNPQSDMELIDKVKQNFLDHPSAENGTLSYEQLQNIKKGTYRAQGKRAYGEQKGATIESEKTLAHEARVVLGERFPELNNLNAREGAMIELMKAVERRFAEVSRRTVLSIKDIPGILLDHPVIQSKLAIALDRARKIGLRQKPIGPPRMPPLRPGPSPPPGPTPFDPRMINPDAGLGDPGRSTPPMDFEAMNRAAEAQARGPELQKPNVQVEAGSPRPPFDADGKTDPVVIFNQIAQDVGSQHPVVSDAVRPFLEHAAPDVIPQSSSMTPEGKPEYLGAGQSRLPQEPVVEQPTGGMKPVIEGKPIGEGEVPINLGDEYVYTNSLYKESDPRYRVRVKIIAFGERSADGDAMLIVENVEGNFKGARRLVREQDLHPVASPSTEAGDVPSAAALRSDVSGKIYTGRSHPDALEKALAAGESIENFSQENYGFTDGSGEFVPQSEARQRYGGKFSQQILPGASLSSSLEGGGMRRFARSGKPAGDLYSLDEINSYIQRMAKGGEIPFIYDAKSSGARLGEKGQTHQQMLGGKTLKANDVRGRVSGNGKVVAIWNDYGSGYSDAHLSNILFDLVQKGKAGKNALVYFADGRNMSMRDAIAGTDTGLPYSKSIANAGSGESVVLGDLAIKQAQFLSREYGVDEFRLKKKVEDFTRRQREILLTMKGGAEGITTDLPGHFITESLVDVLNNQSSIELHGKARADLGAIVDSYNRTYGEKLTTSDMLQSSKRQPVNKFFGEALLKWVNEGDRAGFTKQAVGVMRRFVSWLKDKYYAIKGQGHHISPELEDIFKRVFDYDRSLATNVEAQGSGTSKVSLNYNEAYIDHKGTQDNLWIRQSKDAGNQDRTLMIQFSNELINAGLSKDISAQYFDKQYSQRAGFDRTQDVWEIPFWMAQVGVLNPKSDVYIVRDIAQAQKFLQEAGYGRAAFSALYVTKEFTKELAGANPNTKVAIGGYIDDLRKEFGHIPNVTTFGTVEEYAKSMGLSYRPEFDYRHFKGTNVIPRLKLSSGCKYKCVFCTIPKDVVEVPKDAIDRQVSSLKDLRAKLVYLDDKTFGQASNYIQLAQINKKLKKSNPDFQGFIVQTTAPDVLRMPMEWLKNSGIRYVEIGVESYNDWVLKNVHKVSREKTIDLATQKLREAKIALIPNIIIGMTGKDAKGVKWEENAQSYAHTLDYLKRNQDVISHLNVTNLSVYDGTELANQIESKVDADAMQNTTSAQKSFYLDKDVHQKFHDDLFNYGMKLLDQEPTFSGSAPSVDIFDHPITVFANTEPAIAAAKLLEASTIRKAGVVPNGDLAKVQRAVASGIPEIQRQLQEDMSGVGWYGKDMKDMHEQLQQVLPELSDPLQQKLFTAILTPTSYGTGVRSNLETAADIWRNRGEDGSFPAKKENGEPWTVRGQIVAMQIERLNDLIRQKGEQGAMDWLTSEHPVSELKQWNSNISGKADENRFGAYIFGPKGGTFFLNMNGEHNVITKDIWFSRAWNRWMGTMFDKNGEIQDFPRNQVERRLMDQSVRMIGSELGLAPDDVQAAMWYYEKKLYEQMGAGSEISERISFGKAAKDYAEKQRQEELDFGYGDAKPSGATQEAGQIPLAGEVPKGSEQGQEGVRPQGAKEPIRWQTSDEARKWEVGEKANQDLYSQMGNRDPDTFADGKGGFSAAKKMFGLTDDMGEVGWMLPDGSALDFSGKKNNGQAGSRNLDHRMFGKAGVSMMQALEMGAIRMKPEENGFELWKSPTAAQRTQLKNYIEERYKNNPQFREIVVDYQVKIGDEIVSESKTFKPNQSAQSIINALDGLLAPKKNKPKGLGLLGMNEAVTGQRMFT
jgi:uncharacterized radical SAM superfamily protein